VGVELRMAIKQLGHNSRSLLGYSQGSRIAPERRRVNGAV
jgi:hypothetical protein